MPSFCTRLDQADEALEAARTLLDKGLYRSAMNRAYCGMYYSVLALLAIRRQETSKHSGAISLFDREFVKKGRFTKDLSRWLHDGFELRQRSDYAPKPTLNEEDAEVAMQHAVSFVNELKAEIERLVAELSDN